MRRIFLLAVAGAALAAAGPSPAAEIETLLRDDALWSLSVGELARRHGDFNWKWVESGVSARSSDPGITFAGRRVSESLFRFENGRAARLTVFLYNRGDAGTRTEEEFDAQVKEAAAALTAWAGPAAEPPRSLRVAANARAETQSWRHPPHQATLEWSSSRPRGPDGRSYFRAEYIRLDLAPAEATAAAAALHPPPAPPDRVLREPGGDVRIIEVPMVDQGPKGYCAVAVIERVLRYYGREFDQHQAAQIAGTGETGTASDRLADAARRIAARFRLNFRVLYESDLAALSEDYNRRARRVKAEPITTGRTLYANSIFPRMNGALLREARLDQRADRRRFFEQIREHVDGGAPLIWSVILGFIAEQPPLPQATGGHLRLIIGYHAERQEILYTDSWGAGHELKRMGAEDAWTITMGLYAILPR